MAQQSTGVVRPVISLVCGVLAVVLMPLSLVAVWASIMLTRTDAFVEELSPVVRQPQVQEALADGIVTGVLGAVQLQPAVEQVLEGPLRQGRVFMTPLDDPFALALREVEALRAKTKVIFVDFHAEATSEKIAMGWHLDGLVTAVVGTHTHVQTADERILPKGTACLTDAGMTGPHDSIIGVSVDAALGKFVNAMPAKFEPANGVGRLNAVIVTADPKTGRAIGIERLNLSAAEVEALAAATPASSHG